MTDNHAWQAPGGTPASSAGAAPPPTAPAAPAAPPPPAGWTPPPRPGLIPLRPMQLGTILGAAFRVLRRNPRPTFGVALLVQGIVYIVTIVLIGGTELLALSRISAAASGDASTIGAGSFALILISGAITVLLSVAATGFLQGVIVLEVSRATLGEKQKLPQLFARGRGRFLALIGYTLLLTLAVLVVVGIIIGLIVLFVATLGTVGIVLAVLVGITGFFALVVALVWLGTKLSMVPSALMLERLGIRAAIGRSWSLTTGYFWRTLGIQLLVNLIVSVAQQVLSTPVGLVFTILIPLTDPNGQFGPTTVILIAVFGIVTLVVGVVFGAITAVITTSTTALIYLDLRMRKEGLDLDLARFVEAR
ncbi:MAG: hypothetical protein V4479_11520, partial [Actinomycetota bacterium]